MTDFLVERIKAVAILAALDDVESKLDTLHTDLAKLHAQTVHTFVDAILFNEEGEDNTATGLDVSAYRDFALLLDLAVVGAPTDIVIRVEFSDDDSTYYRLMNGPFGDLRFEDSAGAKKEAIVGKIIAPYMRTYVLTSGCDGSKTFTLTAKVVLTR